MDIKETLLDIRKATLAGDERGVAQWLAYLRMSASPDAIHAAMSELRAEHEFDVASLVKIRKAGSGY